MKIQCDACEGAAATVVCCADEAALCARCDVEIHAANKLASKHQRLPLEALSSRLPRCDVCQEKAAFIFCVEDRALFCRDCDEPIHVPGTLSGNHQRYLATGIRVGLASASACGAAACDAHDSDHGAPPKATVQPPPPQPAVSAAAQQVPSPPQFMPQSWAVDELLQFSDYESGDKASHARPPSSSMSKNSRHTRLLWVSRLMVSLVFCSCRRSRLSGSRSWSGSPTSTSSRRPPRPAGRWRRSRSFSDPRRQTTRRATGRAKQLPGQGCARTRRHGSRSLTTRMITSSSLILVKKERESFV
ncbi:hypothetical protein HU200_062313 [Digitaria exilis]|uniref:B box-type domain-containing protein n=1 Tax=Digitaria exilis TaxID=1010633 RepID=A0A835ADD6_9POAL|nr:hypothetical protein HU200_062313 [Digitaria exilis]